MTRRGLGGKHHLLSIPHRRQITGGQHGAGLPTGRAVVPVASRWAGLPLAGRNLRPLWRGSWDTVLGKWQTGDPELTVPLAFDTTGRARFLMHGRLPWAG
jgi:hypothetical protein